MPSRLIRGHTVILAQLAAGLPLYRLGHGHPARSLSVFGSNEGWLWHVAYLVLRLGSSRLVLLRLSRQVDVCHLRRVVYHDFAWRSAWSRQELALLLSLVARLSDGRRLTPAIRVDVDVDHSTASLSGYLMLRAGNRRTILSDAVDLHLELVWLVASALMLHQRLLEVLGRVEVPRQLLVGEVVWLLHLILLA